MIDSWSLSNFKSVEKETTLSFRPLTVFSGANSSGKSTVLQSILLVAQTLQNPIASRSVVLNGAIKQLGSYSDIVSMRDSTKNIQIGFTVSVDKKGTPARYYSFDENVSSVDCKFELSSQKPEEDLHPCLDSFVLCSRGDGKEENLQISRRKNDDLFSKESVLRGIREKLPKSNYEYDVQSNSDNRRLYSYQRGETQLKYVGAQFFHFLPNFLFGAYNIKDRYQAAIRCLADEARIYYGILSNSEEQTLEGLLKVPVLDIAKEVYDSLDSPNKTVTTSYNRLSSNFSFDHFGTFIQKAKALPTFKSKYSKRLHDIIKALDDSYGLDRIPAFYLPGIEFVRSFFTENIKYLGPLRDEPKAIYPLEVVGSIADVGLKGENTAAVYDVNKSSMVPFIEPCDCASGKSDLLKQVSLAEAINKWLVYLGVANSINTSDRGKFGHELKIQTEGIDLQQDLTHVGVGVSQILPILVLCLLSPKGSVIILEQPELHLHPKVQTRLADFFVGLNALGKQCIIETHSEYFINRLRYLVAKSSDNSVSEQTMIYFVEKEDGNSHYRPITINKYGVIEDWPKGFFDESEDIASDVLKAGMEKRKQEFRNSPKYSDQ